MNLRRPLILFVTLLLGSLFLQGAQAASQAPAARTLYLMRHGAYDNEAARTVDGPGLVPLGIAQARLTAARLQALPNTPKTILASSMLRARQTAAVLHESLPQVPIETTDALRECTPSIAGRDGADAAHACEQRLDAAYTQYFVPAAGTEETDVLVCHGNVIRYFVMKALAVDATHWLQMTVGNASITVIRVEANGAIHVLSVGDVGHLPPNLQSGIGDRDPQLVAP
jgi:serine/threonine-protein phosphatase PGAM5